MSRLVTLCVLFALSGCANAETMQIISQWVVGLGIGLSAIGGIAAFTFGKRVDREKEDAQHQKDIRTDKQQADLRAEVGTLLQRSEVLEAGNKELKEQATKLQTTADGLQAQLEPFEEFAKKLHSSLGRDEALKRLQDELQSMKTEIKAELKTERDARANLQKNVAPRELSSEQQASIAKGVHDIGGLPVFTIHVPAGDAEAARYARQLQAALNLKGINFEQGGPLVTAKGLIIAVPPQQPGRAPAGAQRLGEVLKRAGLAFTIEPRPGLSGDALELVVGGKP